MDSYFPSTDFHEHAIVSVEVTYDARLLFRSVHKHYKIEVTPEGHDAVSLVSSVNDDVIVVAAEDGSVVALFV